MTDTLRAAAAATNAVTEHVATATLCLREFREVSRNAAGILAAPAHQRRDITAAIDALGKAMDVIDNTNWPSEEDYHAL